MPCFYFFSLLLTVNCSFLCYCLKKKKKGRLIFVITLYRFISLGQIYYIYSCSILHLPAYFHIPVKILFSRRPG